MRLHPCHHLRIVLDTPRAGPEREHPNGELAAPVDLVVEVPLRLADAWILRASHPFPVEVLDHLEQALPLLLARIGGHQPVDQSRRRLFQYTGWIAVGVAIDRPRER